MGAWGVGSFEKDGAMDLAGEVAEEADDLSPVEQALATISEAGDEYLEAPHCEAAIVAL